MTNREKYKFDDFTLDNYRRLIRIAKEQGFRFILHKDEYVADRKDVIWRHDVEFSPDIALKMAHIENEEGVQATYFFQMHCNYYNTFDRHYTKLLHEIESLGHHIGLHFDSHYWNIQSEEDLNKYVLLDRTYFDTALGTHIDTFSFHNTNKFILTECKSMTYGGLLNVYADYFKEHYDYCGDSTGIWRFDRLEDQLLDPKIQHLQVLTHDGMWSEEVKSPHKRVMSCIQDRADYLKHSYMVGLPKGGNINVDDDCINPGCEK